MSAEFELYLGNCFDAFQYVEPRSVKLILADLPYGTTNCNWDTPLSLPQLWAEYKRILAPGGCVLLFGSMQFCANLFYSNTKWYSHDLVGDKNKCGSPGLAKYRPMRTHEHILLFAPGSYTYNPQMEKGDPYKRNPPKKIRCNTHGYGFAGTASKGIENTGTRYPKSIIDMRRDFSAQQQLHGAQKPVHTLRWLIRTYSNRCDLVLDNTMGCGSTGVASLLEERLFIGMENDPAEYRKAEPRILSTASSVKNPTQIRPIFEVAA